jgi:hypothetical protein
VCLLYELHLRRRCWARPFAIYSLGTNRIKRKDSSRTRRDAFGDADVVVWAGMRGKRASVWAEWGEAGRPRVSRGLAGLSGLFSGLPWRLILIMRTQATYGPTRFSSSRRGAV